MPAAGLSKPLAPRTACILQSPLLLQHGAQAVWIPQDGNGVRNMHTQLTICSEPQPHEGI